MHELDSNPARPFSVLEIRRAIAHHRRAIDALHDGTSFQGLQLDTAERLIRSLEADLRQLEDELGRRRMGYDLLSAIPDSDVHNIVPTPAGS